MFEGLPDATKRAKGVVKKLTDYSGNKAHDRHIHIDECKDIGLKITPLEDDDVFQDLVLTVHHCYMHVFQKAQAYKMIENHRGVAVVKNVPIKPS